MNRENLPQGLIKEETLLSFQDLCGLCQIQELDMMEMVAAGILEPRGHSVEEWQFSLIQIHRLRRAQRLQQDLQLNLDGVALTLELLDELQVLRNQNENLIYQLKLLTKSST